MLPSPVQDRVLVRLTPTGRARNRGRHADRNRPQEWGYGSVHAATRAHFKGFATSPVLAPRRQFPRCSPRGERRRKLTGTLDDFLIALLQLRRLVRTHQARRCEVNPAKVCCWTWSGPSFIPK